MVTIRPAVARDAAAAAAVVEAVYAEYGFTWQPGLYHADLVNLGAHYLARGWPFWVAEHDGAVVGTCGLELFTTVPGRTGTLVTFADKPRLAGCDCALERLYVLRAARRLGTGRRLADTAAQAARAAGRRAMEIWSDKRFEAAHTLYGKLGAHRVAERICPGDPDESSEWGFVLELA